jgi:phosphosulfolactate synthase
MFNEYMGLLDKHEIELVEVSDGSYDIDHNKKLEYISILAKRGTVISEVGSKKKDVIYTPDEWVEMMKSELNAGSVKVIAEARESGTIGSITTMVRKHFTDQGNLLNAKLGECNLGGSA